MDDEKKLISVPYILEGEADFWWDMVTRTEDMGVMSWSGFEKIFLAKYFPIVEREARREEFERLFQRGLMVAQYEAKFTELSRHAKDLVDTEEKKVRRFLGGLKPPIHHQLVVLMLTEYRDVVNRALVVERCLDDRLKRNERMGGGRPQGRGGFMKKQKVQGGHQGKQVVCFKCKKVGHLSHECKNCFICGQSGHVKRFCPHGGQQSVVQ